MTRIAIVTGANSGIGLETARGLAHAGSAPSCSAGTSGGPRSPEPTSRHRCPPPELDVVLCDLGVQADVRRAAADIEARFDRLDVLVNNAAMTIRKKERTIEDIDAMLAVNHLGPFLLTNLLLPLLQRSAPSRVVVVASEGHKFRKLRVDDLQGESRGTGPLGLSRYGETKLMNILFTRSWPAGSRAPGSPPTASTPAPSAPTSERRRSSSHRSSASSSPPPMVRPRRSPSPPLPRWRASAASTSSRASRPTGGSTPSSATTTSPASCGAGRGVGRPVAAGRR